ncbi:5'/3'-nucleotidase SurE [Leptothoe sp. PORK10 BA2]|uniref:5'/3'-nucleotidase SurE n=1 Tax=Leptothoe sp. PORK10 BA2 TaxID=3110254 RepID=UPI002B2107FD|nr:5'/3'-nucleotidase SurE [Leptothoe sp. PORK10 BA2]MEA5462788.1 5'/3'-nucleotidase SurE [Leptothoe sp. PORK10 BA2]
MINSTTIALTNDDGIDAPGIQALHQALIHRLDLFAGISVGIVAPDQHLSGCSHQINRGGPISVEQRVTQQSPIGGTATEVGRVTTHRYAIGGTPADCTRVAHHLYPQLDWVLSGINDGGNLGADIHVSGTVAAAREATLLRIPAMAISHYKSRNATIDWDVAARRVVRVLNVLMERPLNPGQFWNVNLPSVDSSGPEPAIVFCPVCTQPLPTPSSLISGQFRYTGTYQDRHRDPGADVDVCFGGNISVSQISLW